MSSPRRYTPWFFEQIFPLISAEGQAFAVAGIATDITRRKQAEEAAALFRRCFEHAPDMLFTSIYPIDWERPLIHVNATATRLLAEESEIRRWLARELEKHGTEAIELELERTGTWQGELKMRQEDTLRVFDASAFVVGAQASDTDGGVIAWFLRDVSRAKQLERERTRLQEQVIAAQALTLAELSAPLMQLAPGVLAVPLIGHHDEERSEHLIEVLPNGITEHRARHVLLDLTGMPEMDVMSASALPRIARIIRLLGAKLVLTGVSPTVASTLGQAHFGQLAATIESTMGEGLNRVLREMQSSPGSAELQRRSY